MSKHSLQATTADVDALRRLVCSTLAAGMKSGVMGFQFRFIKHQDGVSHVWVYHHFKNEWRQQAQLTESTMDAESLLNEFEAIAKRVYADDWSCRQSHHGDHVDFELGWRRDAVESHLHGQLESYLEGCLFYGHHDSGKDSRRRIRFEGH